MSILEVPGGRSLAAAKARVELAALDYNRAIQLAAGTASQRTIAKLVNLSQPRINQIVNSTPRPPDGFSGASPREIAQRFAAGELTEAETIDQLSRWEYNEPREVDEYDGTWEPGAGTFAEVGDAVEDGLLTDEIYDAVLNRKYGTADDKAAPEAPVEELELANLLLVSKRSSSDWAVLKANHVDMLAHSPSKAAALDVVRSIILKRSQVNHDALALFISENLRSADEGLSEAIELDVESLRR